MGGIDLGPVNSISGETRPPSLPPSFPPPLPPSLPPYLIGCIGGRRAVGPHDVGFGKT
jgi:hypothetical protein